MTNILHRNFQSRLLEDTPAEDAVKAAEGRRVPLAGTARLGPGGSAPEWERISQREARRCPARQAYRAGQRHARRRTSSGRRRSGRLTVGVRGGRAACVDPLGREVPEDRADHLGLGDERDDPHGRATARTDQGIDVADAADDLGPAATQRADRLDNSWVQTARGPSLASAKPVSRQLIAPPEPRLPQVLANTVAVVPLDRWIAWINGPYGSIDFNQSGERFVGRAACAVALRTYP